MNRTDRMMLENKAWAQSKLDMDPQYFQSMAVVQNPTYLWIGCSDSRVPPSEITNTDPGEMFVQRNIANLVIHTDMNLLSVIEYGVFVLKIPHIIVCGHYNCGGVRAALSHQSFGLIDNWVRNIKDTSSAHRIELEQISGEMNKVNRLVELNVIEQVKNLSYTSIVQKSWKDHHSPTLHGWVYDLETGRLKELSCLEPNSPIDETHRYEF